MISSILKGSAVLAILTAAAFSAAQDIQVQVNGQLAKGCKWHNASNTLTQATLALVPAKNFNIDDDLIFSADDIAVGSQVPTLMPGIEDKGTGLCPPSCPRTPVGGH